MNIKRSRGTRINTTERRNSSRVAKVLMIIHLTKKTLNIRDTIVNIGILILL